MTQSQLKSELHYDKTTGIFTRITSYFNTHIGREAKVKNNRGYINVWIGNKANLAHKLAWLYVYGYIPKAIDHINHNREDNRIANLREVTHQENCKNKSMNINNKSGFNGVCYVKSRKKWQVQLRVETKDIWIGRYDNKEDAINARQEANIKYGFHKNHGQR